MRHYSEPRRIRGMRKLLVTLNAMHLSACPESLVVLHRNVAQAIDHGSLSRAELDPFRAIELHGFVKLF